MTATKQLAIIAKFEKEKVDKKNSVGRFSVK
jgi:hypothetical protein